MKKFLLTLIMLYLLVAPAYACFISSYGPASDAEIKTWYDDQRTIYQGIKLREFEEFYGDGKAYDYIFVTKSLKGPNRTFQLIKLRVYVLCKVRVSRFGNNLWGMELGHDHYTYLHDPALDSLEKQNLVQNSYLISKFAIISYISIILYILVFLFLKLLKRIRGIGLSKT